MSSDLLPYFTERTEYLVATVEDLARLESPSDNKEYVDRLVARVKGLCENLGAAVTVYPCQAAGDIMLAQWNASAPGKPIMFLTHLDTVWPVGTLNTMPIRRENGLLYGPGVLDMKAGVALAILSVGGLIDRGELPNRPIWILFNTDEETGSANSRDLIHELAAQAGLVLVMEPATQNESLKSWRKGLARYKLLFQGRASHSGFAPEQGINAVIEAAHQALFLDSLNDLPNGTSVAVTRIRGGIAINVIPADAWLEADIRFLKASEAERVDRAVRAITPVVPGAQITIEGGIDRGPMERNAQMVRAVDHLRAIGQSLGLSITEAGSGGGSDGNFTAAMGIPTLDGLGPAGEGLHAANEHLVIASMPRRAALLARMLQMWDMDRCESGLYAF